MKLVNWHVIDGKCIPAKESTFPEWDDDKAGYVGGTAAGSGDTDYHLTWELTMITPEDAQAYWILSIGSDCIVEVRIDDPMTVIDVVLRLRLNGVLAVADDTDSLTYHIAEVMAKLPEKLRLFEHYQRLERDRREKRQQQKRRGDGE